jgi:hypothetical protein
MCGPGANRAGDQTHRRSEPAGAIKPGSSHGLATHLRGERVMRLLRRCFVSGLIGSALLGSSAMACDKHAHSDPGSPVQDAIVAMAQSKGAPPGAPLPTREVVLLRASPELIDVTQFVISKPDTCTDYHWHAANGVSVTTLRGTVVLDPEPSSCGYGTAFSMKSRVFDVLVVAPDSDFDGIANGLDPAPDSADANNDGVPDGNADTDLDGLSDAFERAVSLTNPDQADSDGNGVIDEVDFVLARADSEFAIIPVIVNIYAGSNGTVPHLREAIAKANVVLAKIRVQLVLSDAGPSEAGDGTAYGGLPLDGLFTPDDALDASLGGFAELVTSPLGNGLKIIVAAPGIFYGSTTPGASRHRKPVILIEQRDTPTLTGSTIAHELMHAATLDHPEDGSAEDTPGNIMTPSNAGRDDFVNSGDPDKGLDNISMTDGQWLAVELDGIARGFGFLGGRRSPARMAQYEKGLGLDALADQAVGAGAYLDLVDVQMNSDETLDNVHVLLGLAAQLPATGTPGAVYRLLFDADASTASGSTIQGTAGIDIEVQLVVAEGTGGRDLVLRRFAYPGPTRTPLFPFADLWPVTVRADRVGFPDYVSGEIIELRLEKTSLAMIADEVPVRIIAQTSETGPVVDDVSLVYDRRRWQQHPALAPALEMVAPGEALPLAISGLTPNAPFTLTLDGVTVLDATLDTLGAYSGSFIAPAIGSRPVRFLVAQDASGLFAGSSVLVQPQLFSDGFENLR